MCCIPYGTRYTSTVRGSMYKEVACENCKQAYVYKVERSASSSQVSVLWLDGEGCKRRASEGAQESLHRALDTAVDPVACPDCGWLQQNMCRILKRRRLNITLLIALPVALILFVWGMIALDGSRTQGTALLVAATIAGVGGTLLAVVLSYVHDPNRLHPGSGGRNELAATKSKGQRKVAFDAENAQTQAEFKRRFHYWLLQWMMHMASTSGTANEAKLASVREIFEQVTETNLDANQLRFEAGQIAPKRPHLLVQLTELSEQYSDAAKDLYLRAGLAVAAADGQVDAQEWDLLVTLGKKFNFTQQRFDAVVDSMRAS